MQIIPRQRGTKCEERPLYTGYITLIRVRLGLDQSCLFERIVTTLSCGAAASEAAGLERERLSSEVISEQ